MRLKGIEMYTVVGMLKMNRTDYEKKSMKN